MIYTLLGPRRSISGYQRLHTTGAMASSAFASFASPRTSTSSDAASDSHSDSRDSSASGKKSAGDVLDKLLAANRCVRDDRLGLGYHQKW